MDRSAQSKYAILWYVAQLIVLILALMEWHLPSGHANRFIKIVIPGLIALLKVTVLNAPQNILIVSIVDKTLTCLFPICQNNLIKNKK
jgi:hypothetical protein